MNQLFFARHGESYVNVEHIFATKAGTLNDKSLTPLGIEQAHTVGRQAGEKNQAFDLIVSSPLKRARETASIIASYVNYPESKIVINDLFLEIQLGALEGTPWADYWDSGKTYADLHEVKNSETIESLQQRAATALAYIRTLPEKNILIVSHSAFGRAFRRTVNGVPFSDEFENHKSLPHAEIIQLI